MTSPQPGSGPEQPTPAGQWRLRSESEAPVGVTDPVPAVGAAAGKTVERPHPLTGVAKSWIALFGLVFVFGRDVMENGLESIRDFGPFLWVVGGVVLLYIVLNLVWGIIAWRTTTFVADDEEFRIERNFLQRESSRISYGKIQSVDIERSLPARMLGLSSVRIDVGGAGGKTLEFLGRERAESLRDQLLANMRSLALQPSDGGTDGESREEQGDAGVPATARQEQAPVLEQLIEMTTPTLLLGLFVSSFLPWIVIGVGLVVASIISGRGFGIAAMGGVAFGIGGYLYSQIVGNWNFTLNRVPDGLHIRRGLFTKVSKSLKTDRIQAVSIHQDYLQRLTGLYRVRVTVLGFALGESSETASMVLPYGRWEDVQRVLGAFWPGINLSSIELHGQPRRARWLTPLGFKHHMWGADDQTLVAHHGWLDHTISLVPHRRMQSIGLTQGPLQRRLDLATIAIHTTDGPVGLQVYHLDSAEARALFNAQVERGRAAREQTGDPGYLTALPAPEAAARIPEYAGSMGSQPGWAPQGTAPAPDPAWPAPQMPDPAWPAPEVFDPQRPPQQTFDPERPASPAPGSGWAAPQAFDPERPASQAPDSAWPAPEAFDPQRPDPDPQTPDPGWAAPQAFDPETPADPGAPEWPASENPQGPRREDPERRD